MKKKIQKLVSFLMVCMLMASMMVVNVSAAEAKALPTEGTLTLTEGQAGEKADSKFSVYKIMDAKEVAGQDVYEYTYTANFVSFNEKYPVTTVASYASGIEGDYNITGDIDKLASELENHVKTKSIAADQTMAINQHITLNAGYYLVLETTITQGTKQTKPILVAVPSAASKAEVSDTITYTPDVIVTLKDQPLSTTKTIEESQQTQKDSLAQQVGKEFTFIITQDVPVYDDTYKNVVFKVTDTMSKGLTLVDKSVTVTAGDTPLNTKGYDLKTTHKPDGTTVLAFDFSKNENGSNYYRSVKDKATVTITYKAKLNKDADFTPEGNENEVYATFGEDKSTETIGTKDFTRNYAGGLKITKKDAGDNSKLLAGAEFTVYEDDSTGKNPSDKKAELVTYTVDSDGNMTETRNEKLSATATTDNNGVVRFEGLGAGTYWIKETKAPTGYIALKDPIKVVVNVTLPETVTEAGPDAVFTYTVSGNGTDGTLTLTNGSIAEFDVQNTKGFTLPTTGGMGTYIFTIGGVLLIGAAVVLFIRSRKKAD